MIRHRLAVAVCAVLLFAVPLVAFERGDVYAEFQTADRTSGRDAGFDFWLYAPAMQYATAAGAQPLLTKPVPYVGGGPLLIPSTNVLLFQQSGTVGWWDGVNRAAWTDEPAYRTIFNGPNALSDFARLGPGHYLIAEASSGAVAAKLIEFDLAGRFRDVAMPVGGALHIFAMPDGCTLLYTSRYAGTANRVRRMNLCTGAALADFASLDEGDEAGAIRLLPNGDVVVAGRDGVTEFSPTGEKVRLMYTPDAEYLALSPDASSLWVSGVAHGVAYLRVFGLAAPWDAPREIPLGNPGMTSSSVPVAASDLAVVGEWQAPASVPRRERVARH